MATRPLRLLVAAGAFLSPSFFLVGAAPVLATDLESRQGPSSPPAARIWTGPQGQAATAAQDALTCGFLLLPAQIRLIENVPGLLQRSGAWQSKDGGTLATWVQEVFRLSPDNVYYYRGPQMLFKSEHGASSDEVVLQDCESIPLYSFRLLDTGRYAYDIFDSSGRLIAKSRYGKSDYFPNQVLFTDITGAPVAVAQSPMVVRPRTDGFTVQPHFRNPDLAVAPWEVAFYNAATTNSTLIQAQQRWAVTAAVQEMALDDARQNGVADLRIAFVALCAAACAAALWLVFLAWHSIYELVYPKVHGEDSNPFLKGSVGAAAYGSLAARSTGPCAAPLPPALRPNGPASDQL